MTAPNTSPIFTLTPVSTWAKIIAADTGTDGTGTNVYLCLTSGAAGDFVQKLILQPISTSGSTTTSACALRIYINNGSTVGSATNNLLWREVSLGAIAVNVSATAAALGVEVPFNFQIQSAYKIYVAITAIAANTQWNCLAVCGDY